jgi:MFS family permease
MEYAGYSLEDLEDGPFNWHLAIFVTIAASAGSLFGYDLGLIGTISNVPGFNAFMNGGTLPPPLVSTPLDGSIANDPFCTGSIGVGQILTFTLFGGGMIGGALGSLFCPMFGRRATLVYAAAIFGLGVLLQGTAVNVAMFYIARVIMGAGVGVTNQVEAQAKDMARLFSHRSLP